MSWIASLSLLKWFEYAFQALPHYKIYSSGWYTRKPTAGFKYKETEQCELTLFANEKGISLKKKLWGMLVGSTTR